GCSRRRGACVFFSSRRRHTRFSRDWSSDVCSSDLYRQRDIGRATGVGLGYFFPNISNATDALSVGTTNIPLAIGLILMMYPPLAKVDYSLLPKALKDTKVIRSEERRVGQCRESTDS